MTVVQREKLAWGLLAGFVALSVIVLASGCASTTTSLESGVRLKSPDFKQPVGEIPAEWTTGVKITF